MGTHAEYAARRLRDLRRYATRYELAVCIDGSRYRLGYLVQRGRGVMLRALLSDDAARAAVLKVVEPEAQPSYSARDGWTFPARSGAAISVYFTGRTEREALTAGELPLVTW